MTPYEMGYSARCSGKGKNSNPFHRPSNDYYEWVRGWDAADADTKVYR